MTYSRTRSWYASQVVSLMDLPPGTMDTLGKNSTGAVIVRRLFFDDYKLILPNRLDSLGENRVDRHRAAVSEEIASGYSIALAMLNGDI